MKLREWEQQREQGINISPLRGNPIFCPECKHLIGYEKDFMFMLIPEPGIVCPVCDEIVIWSLRPTYREGDSYTGDPPLDKLPKIESSINFFSISLLKGNE